MGSSDMLPFIHFFLPTMALEFSAVGVNGESCCDSNPLDPSSPHVYISPVSQQVVVDTAQIENKEAYAPQINLEGSRVVVQVPSTW